MDRKDVNLKMDMKMKLVISGNADIFRWSKLHNITMSIFIKEDSHNSGDYYFEAFIAEYGNILLTDTIPEYGRYTFNGSSIDRNGSINIIKMLPDRLKPYVKIADSQSYVDIKNLAKKCVDENLLPLDPGLLIKYYLEMV